MLGASFPPLVDGISAGLMLCVSTWMLDWTEVEFVEVGMVRVSAVWMLDGVEAIAAEILSFRVAGQRYAPGFFVTNEWGALED